MSFLQPDQQSALHGVVIAVAKKLGKNHEEYNAIAVELGGDFSWLYHENVTHFIFEVRLFISYIEYFSKMVKVK